jgi:chemotaxis protein methyltransferase CheR
MTHENQENPQGDERHTSDLIAGIVRVMNQAHGLDISGYAPHFLEKSIANRIVACRLASAEAYEGVLALDPVEAVEFQASLRISYTEFFRNSLIFGMLEERILPHLIAAQKQGGRREIRVWSAGCATGQETWSIVILLDELTRHWDPPPAYRVFATDLCVEHLAFARAGEYHEKALGNVRLRHLEDCFLKNGDIHVISPHLRPQVDFGVHDLLDQNAACPTASIFGDFDLIICCNLLFYYRPEVQHQILDKFTRALHPGGYLVTDDSGRGPLSSHHTLYPVLPNASIFQKIEPQAQPGRPDRYNFNDFRNDVSPPSTGAP